MPIGIMRIIWAAMILGEMAFAAVTMLILWPARSPLYSPDQAQMMTIVAAGMMVVVLPLAFVLRRAIRGPVDAADMSAARYLAGNIVFLALCEAVVMVGIIAILFKGSVGEQILVPAVGVAMQIVNYPSAPSSQGRRLVE
ncbi:MAG TPA: hypothetical protein VG722_05225 [Tepidisphaeraceae bacterium]|nr:hypothetical protein [Tepidisphaeraceae bacterium]